MNRLKEATSKSISLFISLCLYLFGTIFVGIFPDKAREVLGDTIVAIYNYFPIWGWVIVGVLFFVAIFIFNVFTVSKEKTTSSEKDLGTQITEIEISQTGNSNVGKQSAGTIINNFGKVEGEIKDNNAFAKKTYKSESALQICKLAEEFKHKFQFIRYASTLQTERDELSEGRSIWLLRQKKAEESLRNLIDYFKSSKYYFDCRIEVEEELQKLSSIFISYSNSLEMWEDRKNMQVFTPSLNTSSFQTDIFGSSADKIMKETDEIIEKITLILTPYIRGEK